MTDQPAARVAIIGKGADALQSTLQLESSPLETADAAIFIVSAADGIVRADNDLWEIARERYIPSLVVISDLNASLDLDFEDMSAIASKMLDQVATPYLVLHDESSAPVALIDLTTMAIRDYSTGSPVERSADPEHKEIVADFAEEYVELLEASGEDGFTQGLLFPALPWVPSNHLGEVEIKSYLSSLNIVPRAS